MSKAVKFFLALLFVFVGSMAVLFASRMRDDETANDGNHVSVPDSEFASSIDEESLESFVLTDQKGRKFESDSLVGKVWVGSIFFSSCPSTCRMQNMRVAELQQKFAERGVELVSITCDPANDTPSVLNDYAKTFGAKEGQWHFLTGDLDLIKKIGGQKFGIPVDDKVHSDRLILFDRQGQLVGTYRSLEPDQFTNLVAELESQLSTSDADEEREATGELQTDSSNNS